MSFFLTFYLLLGFRILFSGIYRISTSLPVLRNVCLIPVFGPHSYGLCLGAVVLEEVFSWLLPFILVLVYVHCFLRPLPLRLISKLRANFGFCVFVRNVLVNFIICRLFMTCIYQVLDLNSMYMAFSKNIIYGIVLQF
ncbi:hypothetical protein LINGRAHAP2_LOCUS32740 [Linum grandiflorum]